MESIKNRQGHRHMRYNRPRPVAKKLEMCRSEFRSVLLQRVYRPHRHIGNNQERDQLPAGLVF